MKKLLVGLLALSSFSALAEKNVQMQTCIIPPLEVAKYIRPNECPLAIPSVGHVYKDPKGDTIKVLENQDCAIFSVQISDGSLYSVTNSSFLTGGRIWVNSDDLVVPPKCKINYQGRLGSFTASDFWQDEKTGGFTAELSPGESQLICGGSKFKLHTSNKALTPVNCENGELAIYYLDLQEEAFPTVQTSNGRFTLRTRHVVNEL